jgi:hypothetical protein
MSNWYYVQGTERMGPVGEQELHNKYIEGIIQEESYVWTKGFANWEKLHDVDSLKYFIKNAHQKELKKESPEIQFSFDWDKTGLNDEIFYIMTGKDRQSADTEIMGPYSLQELQGAFVQKRINQQTIIYTPGMLYWERIGAIPALQDRWKLSDSVPGLSEMNSPGLIILDRQPVSVVCMIKKLSGNILMILCGHHVFEGDELLVSLYKSEKLMAKNIVLKVIGVNQVNQIIECDLSALNIEQKKIMSECAE